MKPDVLGGPAATGPAPTDGLPVARTGVAEV